MQAWTAPPDWQEFQDAKNFKFDDDLLAPAVEAQYGAAYNDAEDGLNTAFAGAVPETVKSRILSGEKSRINNDRSNALAQGQYQRNQQGWEQQKYLAALKAPQSYTQQSYGYGSQQAQPQQNPWLQAGATVLGAFL